MSLSTHIQDEATIRAAIGRDPSFLRKAVIARGNEWFRKHPGELALIAANLVRLGISADAEVVTDVKDHTFLHYYEKLLPLVLSPSAYADYLRSRVQADAAVKTVRAIQQSGRAVLLAISHFGAVELVTPTLSLHGLRVTAAIRFTTEHFSAMAHRQAKMLEAGGAFTPINFIEIGKPNVQAALEMAAVIRRGEVLTSVFDERTEYSIPTKLLDVKVWGGSGLDRLMQFARAPLSAVTAFMVRLPNETYELRAQEVALDGKSTIQAMYHSLENVVQKHLEQWYFLHEEIPFIE